MFADLWRDVIQDVRRPHEMHRNLYLTCGFLWFESLDTVGNIQDNVSAQLKISTHFNAETLHIVSYEWLDLSSYCIRIMQCEKRIKSLFNQTPICVEEPKTLKVGNHCQNLPIYSMLTLALTGSLIPV